MSAFEGFEDPKQNWSKLPNALIGALPLVETEGELKIILYVLRHTWGYHDQRKKITLDEFANGRKDKDGERMDNGTGLSIPTIRNGLQRAIEHGFINHEQDARDPARVKNFYSLKMAEGEKVLHPEYKEDSARGQESLPRTEKETLERQPEKERGGGASLPPARADSHDPTDLPEAEAQAAILFPQVAQQSCDGVQQIQRSGWHIRDPDHLQAMACFLDASRLPIPPKKSRNDWLGRVDDHLQIYGLEALRELYPRVIAQMRGAGLTVSRPGSVTNNLASYWAEHKNGGKHARPAEQGLDDQSRQISAALEARARGSPGRA